MPWNKNVARIVLVFIASTLMCVACAQKDGFDPQFVKMYAELRVVTQEFGNTTEEGRRARLRLLGRYGYTPARFDSTVALLESDPANWRTFQRELVNQLDSMQPKVIEPAPVPNKTEKPSHAK